MDILAASIKENLWHKMRSDLASYIPQLTENNLLMCCTCGRFLPYEDFSLEHIIPRQALADDPKEIKTTLKQPPTLEVEIFCFATNPYRSRAVESMIMVVTVGRDDFMTAL